MQVGGRPIEQCPGLGASTGRDGVYVQVYKGGEVEWVNVDLTQGAKETRHDKTGASGRGRGQGRVTAPPGRR